MARKIREGTTETTPSTSFHTTATLLKTTHISFTLTQILTGHAFNRSYLDKFKITETDVCPATTPHRKHSSTSYSDPMDDPLPDLTMRRYADTSGCLRTSWWTSYPSSLVSTPSLAWRTRSLDCFKTTTPAHKLID